MNTANITPIERKIFGQNLIHSYTKVQIEHIYPQLQKMVGTKIWNQKVSSKKFQISPLHFPFMEASGSTYRKYFHNNGYSLVLENDVTVKDKDYQGGGYGVSYFKHSVNLGTLKDGVLTDVRHLEDLVQYLFQYDLEEQIKIQAEISALETQLRALRSKQIQ